MLVVVILFILVTILRASQQTAQAQLDPHFLESAVQVVALWFGEGGELTALKPGSGAIIHSRGLVLTNSHVIRMEKAGCGDVTQGRLADRVALLRTKEFGKLPAPEFTAVIVKIKDPQEHEADDPEKDMALLVIDKQFKSGGPKNLTQLESLVRDRGPAGLDEAVEALPTNFSLDYPLESKAFTSVNPLDDFLVSGYPLLQQPSALTFSRGPVSAPDLTGIPGFFLLDARDGPGMSGSPVVHRSDNGMVGLMCGVELGRVKFRPVEDAVPLIEAACKELQLSTSCPRPVNATASQPPQASFSFLPAKPYVGVAITLVASASNDPGGRIDRFDWDFGDGKIVINKRDKPEDSDPKPTEQHVFEHPGSFNVKLTVIDNRGLSASTSQEITALPQPWLEVYPRDLRFSVDLSLSLRGPLEIQTQSLEISNAGEGLLNWSAQTNAPWLRVSPAAGGILAGRSLKATVVFDANKILEIFSHGIVGLLHNTVTVTARGAISSPYLVFVDVDVSCSLCAAQVLPVAEFSFSPFLPAPGQIVTFDASQSRPQDHIVSYQWDFGDGTKSTVTTPATQHTYNSPGTFVVRLTVTATWPPYTLLPVSREQLVEVLPPGGEVLSALPCPSAFELLTFSDDFSDPQSGWQVRSDANAEVGYEQGVYGMLLKQPNQLFWSVAPTAQRFTDFCLAMDAQPVSGSIGEYGLLFRYQDENNFYAFSVRTDGYYRLDKRVQGEWVSVIPWTQADTSSPTVVVAEGPQIQLRSAYHVLATLTDSSFSEGNVALFAGTFEDPSLKVDFDNVAVFEKP